ncbi:MAG: G1 family glutamic endopeptidase [Actinomycetota bacterium]
MAERRFPATAQVAGKGVLVKRICFAVAVAATMLVTTLSGSAAAIHRPLVSLVHTGRGTATSTNWSGYAAYNTTFTDVKGSWIQPAATCTSLGKQYASFWVGIDGYKSSSVEQLGTDSDCAGKNKPSYYAWYEMYPNPSVQISGFAVHPGDSISADVSVSGSTYTLSIVNNTTGARFSTQATTTAARSSAEWVAEAPSQCIIVCRVLPLANFGTVNFTGSFATSGGVQHSISGFTNDSITMTTATGTVKAQPSALSADGTSFSDTWHHK